MHVTQAYRVPRARPPIDLALDANEGPPPPPDLLAQAATGSAELMRRYPDAAELERAIAGRLGLEPAQVLVTAGADDALDRACRAFLSDGGELVLPTPTFEMLERYARAAGARVRPVEWPAGPYPVEQVLARCGESTALVAVVSPNNPTGAVARAGDLRRLAQAAPQARLLVDLAYAEFADEDLTSAALEIPGALVTRTFSKAWGLAGLRVGYALCSNAAVCRALRAQGYNYPIARFSYELACCALDNIAYLEETRARTRQAQAGLLKRLAGLPAYEALTSDCSILMLRHHALGAQALARGLEARGLLTSRIPGAGEVARRFVRVSLGRPEANAALLDGLATIEALRADQRVLGAA
jgi:histidinol-phosphate aminotransferase